MKLINIDLPNFAKKEIEKLQEVIAPFAKKSFPVYFLVLSFNCFIYP